MYCALRDTGSDEGVSMLAGLGDDVGPGPDRGEAAVASAHNDDAGGVLQAGVVVRTVDVQDIGGHRRPRLVGVPTICSRAGSGWFQGRGEAELALGVDNARHLFSGCAGAHPVYDAQVRAGRAAGLVVLRSAGVEQLDDGRHKAPSMRKCSRQTDGQPQVAC